MLIPISNRNISIKALPNVDEILDFLSTELPPLSYWLQLALEYYKQNKFTSFEKILHLGTSEEMERVYKESKEEKILMLNKLAAFYFNMAFNCSDNTKREEYLNQASTYIRAADGKDINAKINWISRGYLILAKSQMESAAYYFNNTLAAQPENILALLGRACIHYHSKEYSKSLSLYAKILKHNPNAPPNIRLGLAYCHYKLGNKEIAYKALQRVLALDPNNADALVSLSILELEKGNTEKYLETLVKAYNADKTHCLVNLHLSKHYFYKKDYEKSIKLAEFSLNRIREGDKLMPDISKLRSESYFTLGQCYHAQGDYENAFRHYTQAVRLEPGFILAQYYLGQMYLYQKDINKACVCFELVLEKHPHNYETLKVLGSIYAKQHKKEQALEKLNIIVKANPDDYEVWIEIAQLLEISKPKQALEAYEKALASIDPAPPELWNNIAILRHKTSDQAGAEIAYNMIAEKKKTLIYNKARWNEDNGRIQEAENLYNEVLAEQPHYTDALLRLGILYKKKGDYVKALEYTRTAISYEKKPINALCQKGALEAELGEIRKALETFNKVIMEHSHHDIYALLAMGNQYYESGLINKESYETNLKRAAQYYLKVISLDEYNCYAAIGVAIILAETGDLKQAQDTFKQVYDINQSLDFILVNQATLSLIQGRLDPAIKLYKKAWEKNALDKETLGTYLSTAYFISKNYTESLNILKEIPKTATSMYNIGLVSHEHAVYLCKKANRDVNDTKLAISKIEESLKAYDAVINYKWELKIGIESRVEDKKKIEWAIRKAADKIEIAKRLQEDCQIYLESDMKASFSVEMEKTRTKEQLKELLQQSPEDIITKHPKITED
jgi:RNA polymerase-associated protein CTR9